MTPRQPQAAGCGFTEEGGGDRTIDVADLDLAARRRPRFAPAPFSS